MLENRFKGAQYGNRPQGRGRDHDTSGEDAILQRFSLEEVVVSIGLHQRVRQVIIVRRGRPAARITGQKSSLVTGLGGLKTRDNVASACSAK